jgi:hypothetical protein
MKIFVYCLMVFSAAVFLFACSSKKQEPNHVEMVDMNPALEKILIERTGTTSIASINEFVYKKTVSYELVGVQAEMNRRADTKGESIMHINVAFIRYKSSSKIEVYDIVQPLHLLQKQEWKETLDQLKIFE